jgi:1-acyl-sn-glycerol-3-phosphate acyltransferase
MAVSGQAWPVSLGLFFVGLFLSAPALAPRLLVLPAATEHEPDLLARARQFQTRYTTLFTYVGLAANVPPLAFALYHSQGGTVPDEVPAVAFWYMVVLSAALCVWCWGWFTRPLVELCLEPVARLLYRVTPRGAERLPTFGPCLVIANHAAWFDPCFLGVILPRPITPIMTQRFYDQWFLKPLLKYVFRVIVVPETPIKRETPELVQAVAALDRGEVVVIFPEGYLRRKEEVPLRRFGQGVWHILHARPDTPVVACWIEGGWGSKFSYKDGPPTKNKSMDVRRKIDIAVSAPEAVPAEVLADQLVTRVHLMNRVAGMRSALGLSPLPAFEVVRVERQEESA